jgi:uncharacterized protein
VNYKHSYKWFGLITQEARLLHENSCLVLRQTCRVKPSSTQNARRGSATKQKLFCVKNIHVRNHASQLAFSCYQNMQRRSIMASTSNQKSGSGNFANDREKASEAGRKGGQNSHSGGHASDTGKESKGSGQKGNFANDREKAAEAGRKGGKS